MTRKCVNNVKDLREKNVQEEEKIKAEDLRQR